MEEYSTARQTIDGSIIGRMRCIYRINKVTDSFRMCNTCFVSQRGEAYLETLTACFNGSNAESHTWTPTESEELPGVPPDHGYRTPQGL